MGDLIIGAVGIVGVLLGLFADRLLQRYGKVRCEIEPMELTLGFGKKGGTDYQSLPIPPDLLPDLDDKDVQKSESRYGHTALRLFLTIKLFNEKEVNTGLRDIRVVFEGRESVECIMQDRATWGSAKNMETLEIINLPSREWVTYDLTHSMKNCQAHKLTGASRAYLQGYFPDGRLYKRRIPQIE